MFSSAHVLGEAMERVYGGQLCYGPPIEQGFYYDMYSDEYKVSSLVLVFCFAITQPWLKLPVIEFVYNGLID